ncbi:hypothetical protein H1R17_07890 [Flavobacterium sp. xlx-214]|uniref:hypothetical protein n=1 Tax=unclassified Flavobacterium TaxID=196869 RepID=UPI0013D404C4|nr:MULTISPECIES: hypothetical protein [unclassified Flavobacterium]MBA5792264.1 hypothetical protein [Flavobacterium sp. xlx-221]QMI82419.1 hypothetical protein H1R17_07890 [Flavobacterium sp. xlx-214]
MKKLYYIFISLVAFACTKKQEAIKNNTSTYTSIENKERVEATDTSNLLEEEKKLLKIHDNITISMGNVRNDSLLAISSQQFTDSLTYLIKNNNNTINYPFDLLQKENALKMATSADKKLRVYSWDTNSGGSMRFFNQMYQFNANGNITLNVSLASNDSQSYFSKIYSVQNNKKETIYLVISNSILSGRYSVQYVDAYKIGTENLIKTPVFKTKTKTLDKIAVDYDFFSVVDRPERPVELITFNNNILKIALVDDNQNVTTKNLIYEWNEDLFIYKGIE